MTIRIKRAIAALIASAALLGSAWALLPSRTARFVEYKTEDAAIPTAIAAAADGTVWFTMDSVAAIGRVRAGKLERLPTPHVNRQPLGLAAAPGGGVWYADPAEHSIAYMSEDGAISRFALDTPSVQLARLAVADDDAVWFAEPTGYSISRLKDRNLQRNVFESPRGAPYGVAIARDGTVWATLQGANQLLRIRPGGGVEAIELKRPAALPSDVAIGPDGSVWIVEAGADRIARYRGGEFEDFEVAEKGSGLSGLAVAEDGAVWFAMLRSGSLGQWRAGKTTHFRLPRERARPYSIALDQRGDVWYADLTGYVGRLENPAARR